ncbi:MULTISPECIES: DNA topoisomerase IV subunit A [Bartonella]|uniref:DNA topoisomerase 4 subunit A n=1 Tax=Bartonella rochalimae ATCC BAA-1498 TaxID=685782 RepID=E6YLL0_9HYPH|nr:MULTISPECIES: DNA topoisomerase IV subunit A [Bartonella]AQX18421.1 DNA topoisomerase IV subunit A [Bartonella sp. A1379B]KEC56757.1 DNA topoisomerase IV, A subunit [Bartonella rochalimae ATCC BAA-1498]CBI77762.1 topoisomerase IV subunit A [Bartonella rochalimae ATCC BAA-1498]
MSDEMIRSFDKEHIEPIELRSALQERYLAYALSTITHRALPDVRDGLKPVHRRIIHAMRLLRLNPGQAYAKCARIVGDVMGKFHPHGDASIYDALVRLAQSFSVRYPLIDGQGNFGNIDGDNAAAMRYTEARMTEVAILLLEGINENAIDFRLTYNEEDEEPIVLPGAFPNLLANGSAGIAVGMATSIPPHNVAELCDAALYLIANPHADHKDLSQFVLGPDFPTGGILVEPKKSIEDSYRTGRGLFRLRSRWHQEEGNRGSYVIVVTEIPYQVQKSRLIEKTAELLLARRLPMLEDIHDESAEDIRIVLVPKNRTIDPELLMESLFKLTDFEVRFPLNLNVLTLGKVPNVLSLRESLQQWLQHRKEVLIRRSNYRLNEIDCRLEILQGYLIAYLNLNEVIQIIREHDEPKKELILRFKLTENQAESILNMRLRSLRKLEEFQLRKEFDSLKIEKEKLQNLLNSNIKQWKVIAEEITRVRKIFGPETFLGKRRTTFEDAPRHDENDIHQAMIEKEPVTIVISEKGWVRALKGHLNDYKTLSFKEGDGLKLAFPAFTTDKIIVISTGGKFFTISANTLPGGRGHGEPIRILVDMNNEHDILTAFVHNVQGKRLLISSYGNGFIVSETDIIANTRKGKQVMNVKSLDSLKLCIPVEGDYIAIVGENRKMLIFSIEQIPEMSRGKGVRLQRYKDGGIVDAKTFTLSEGLSWQDTAERSFNRQANELVEWMGTRAGTGRLVPKGFPKSGKFFS